MKASSIGVATLAASMLAACTTSFFGKSLDDTVPELVVQHVLSSLASGETFTWRDETTGRDYQLSPLGTFRTDDGGYCRDYTIVEVVNETAGRAPIRTACLVDGAGWQPVDPSTFGAGDDGDEST
ncbi:MAG: hypothetical protein AAF543_16300 [Pseudomonadota bacterium]